MAKIIQNYSLVELIGEGSYGKVYRSLKQNDHTQYAIKIIPVTTFKSIPKLEECTVNEIDTLTMMETSPHIIKYIETLKTHNNFYFVYEYCNGGTLQKLLKQQGKLSEGQAIQYFTQLLEAFKILNKHNVIHRDLKPDNIFFDNGTIKLGDFGFCKNMKQNVSMTSTMLGSPIYMAPEILKESKYTSKVDIWSLGVVLYEMLFGFCPFQTSSIAKLISMLDECELRIPLDIQNISYKTQKLLRSMLCKDELKRIGWAELFAEYTQANMLEISIDAKLQRASTNHSKQKSISGYEWFKKGGSMNSLPSCSPSSRVTKFNKTKSNRNDHKIVLSQQSNKTHSINVDKIWTKSVGQPSRKTITKQHAQCTKALKIAIQFIEKDDKDALQYAYIILDNIASVLQSLKSKANQKPELTDINNIINTQQHNIRDMQEAIRTELLNKDFPLMTLQPKIYLNCKFTEKCHQNNLKLWQSMVAFVFQKTPLKADSSQVEIANWIHTCLL